jgi:hypothetical protein
MTKLYQVINFQFDIVATFKLLEDAKDRVDALRLAYKDEGFYVIELTVAYSSFPANSQS